MPAAKKDNTPVLLKIVRWVFPKVEKIFPVLAHRYFVQLFFTPLRYKIPARERKAETYAETFTITVNHKTLQCYSWGRGPKIILLVHGWAGRATQFRRFIKPLLKAGFRVVGFDGPAHGNSTGKETSILEFEHAFHLLYEKVGIPEVVIAHSFGGGAVWLAAMKGLPVKKLISIASPTSGEEILNTYLRAIHGSSRTKEYFKAYTLRMFGKPFDEFTALYCAQHVTDRFPVLLMHDEDDHEVSIQQAEALVKVYPRAQLFRTQGLGHTRILKDDAVIARAVTYAQDSTSDRN